MIRYILSMCTLAISFNTMAQDMDLLNDVVYENKKPLAGFTKISHKNGNDNRTGLSVFNSKRKELLKVVPMRAYTGTIDPKQAGLGLKPFDYYSIVFPGSNDSLSFTTTEVLSLHIFRIIKGYHIIQHNELDSNAVVKLLSSYDNSSFKTQLNAINEFWHVEKSVANQAVRNRTKPVLLVNDNIIMQDSTKLGYFRKKYIEHGKYSASDNYNNQNTLEQTREIVSIGQWEDMYELRMADDTPVSDLLLLTSFKPSSPLYDLSLPLNKKLSAKNKERLMVACWLIENGGL